MGKKLKQLLSVSALALAGTGILATLGKRYYPGEPIIIPERGVEIPSAPYFEIPKNRCAQYARLAAEELFDLNYSVSAAWNRRYNDRIVAQVEMPLGEYVRKGILVPGMIIGVSTADSEFKEIIDEGGERCSYTHNILYLGRGDINSDGDFLDDELFFVHQFVRKIERTTLKDLLGEGFVPREILAPANWSAQKEKL